MSLRPSTLLAAALSTAARSYLLPAALLLTAACTGDVAAPPAPVARKDAAAPAKPAPGARACDVRLTAGVDAPAVDVVEGKTYCLDDLEFTRTTAYAAARASLGGACHEELLEGETRLECKGVVLSFGGPVQILSSIRTTKS